jgi:RNA polymerase sigma-70 factor, ECF subfamily
MMRKTSAVLQERTSEDGGRGRERIVEKPGFAEEALPHLPAVHRFALRLTRGNEAEAEDLVQDTYLRAFRGWETYSPGTKCCSWLFTICRNVAVRKSEGKRHLEQLATNLGVGDVTALIPRDRDGSEAQDPERDFFEAMVDDEVLRAIDRLPPEYRDAVVLCDLEGFGYRDIARRLGVADGTIKSRIHRGRRLLQEALYPYAVEIGYVK